MRNTGLEESQAGIKMAGRNIDNLRYADDTTLTAETNTTLWEIAAKPQKTLEFLASEKNSIRCQRWGLIAQSFCVIKFY